MDKKVMLGHRLRRLRREQGLTQVQLAEQLEISPSYLNLIEHNQRPVSAVLLLKLARTFELDLQTFAEDDEGRVIAGLREVFADPVLTTGESVGAPDLRELAALAPPVTQAIIELYRAFREHATSSRRSPPPPPIAGRWPRRRLTSSHSTACTISSRRKATTSRISRAPPKRWRAKPSCSPARCSAASPSMCSASSACRYASCRATSWAGCCVVSTGTAAASC